MNLPPGAVVQLGTASYHHVCVCVSTAGKDYCRLPGRVNLSRRINWKEKRPACGARAQLATAENGEKMMVRKRKERKKEKKKEKTATHPLRILT